MNANGSTCRCPTQRPAPPECPQCSGEVGGDDAGVLSLAWSIAMNASDLHHSRNWALASIVDGYKRSRSRSVLIDEFVDALMRDSDFESPINGITSRLFAPGPQEESDPQGEPDPAVGDGGGSPDFGEVKGLDADKWERVLRRTADHDGMKRWEFRPPGATRALPKSPRDPSGGSRLRQCGIKKFQYPKCWRIEDEWPFAGIQFEANLEFKEEPRNGYFCDCCVFRQIVKDKEVVFPTGKSPEDGDSSEEPKPPWRYKLDAKLGAGSDPKKIGQYGGIRPDRRTEKAKDDPGAEAKGSKWSANKCELCFGDNPGTVVGEGTTIAMSWDFVGLVFDRCNNWKLVAAKRFVASRTFSASKDGEKISDLAPASLSTTASTAAKPDSSSEMKPTKSENCGEC